MRTSGGDGNNWADSGAGKQAGREQDTARRDGRDGRLWEQKPATETVGKSQAGTKYHTVSRSRPDHILPSRLLPRVQGLFPLESFILGGMNDSQHRGGGGEKLTSNCPNVFSPCAKTCRDWEKTSSPRTLPPSTRGGTTAECFVGTLYWWYTGGISHASHNKINSSALWETLVYKETREMARTIGLALCGLTRKSSGFVCVVQSIPRCRPRPYFTKNCCYDSSTTCS